MSMTGQPRNKFQFRFYRNLNKGGWSVSESGKGIKNEKHLVVFDAQFYSRPAGRAKVIESGVKNVHAYMASNNPYENNHTHFAMGELNSNTSNFIEISYNPFVDPRFYLNFKYRDRIYIEPNWILPMVVAGENKLYIDKGYLYSFLKEQKFEHPNLANKVMFDGIQICDVLKIRDFLHTLLCHRNEIACGGTILPRHTFDESTGLCDNLLDNMPSATHDVLENWLCVLFQEWEHYSGSVYYPVLDLDYCGNDPAKAFRGHDNKYTGNYGASRFKLAEFLLQRLTENVPDLQIK